MKPSDKISPKQRGAMYTYFQNLADAMNDAGYDTQTVIKLPLGLTKDIVKQGIAKVLMNAMFDGMTSIENLTPAQAQQLYETMNNATAEKFGVSMEFPHNEEDEA